MGRPQVVRAGNNTFAMLIFNTGGPQGCVLSSLLYSLFTGDCLGRARLQHHLKFVNDTTVVGLITDNNVTAYREEVRYAGVWWPDNNLSLNVSKTKGADCGKGGLNTHPFISMGCSGAHQELQVRRCPHHYGPNMVQTYQHSREEGRTMPFHSQEAEKIPKRYRNVKSGT
jgi:hypothetical protein